MLIQGDNLDALKALLPYYAGQVKCIPIDPPYNTRSAFEQYDDNLEHAQWLGLLYPRMELLRDFLSKDGSIWVSIDDNEGHYLKVMMDEVFGRKRFVANCVWQKRYSRENREAIGDAHDHILVYANDAEKFKAGRNLLDLENKQIKLYKNADEDPRGPWQSVSLLAQGYRKNQMYVIHAPNGKEHVPPPGRCWALIEPEYKKLALQGRVIFGKDGDGVPRRKDFLEDTKGLVPWTWWPHEEVGHNDESKKEVNVLFGGDVSFGTPKPERLLRRIIQIATNPGDLVLDSFLGSGTTCAVAHKMNRHYIGIEAGIHAETHCAPRLQKVIGGEQGGISESATWTGGGGFRFYRLGDSVFDENGHLASDIRFAPLAAHVWFAETGAPFAGQTNGPFLGEHDGTGYYLLYNGILGDKRPQGGNVLTTSILAALPPFAGPRVIFGEGCRLGAERLQREGIAFRQIPYEIKAR